MANRASGHHPAQATSAARAASQRRSIVWNHGFKCIERDPESPPKGSEGNISAVCPEFLSRSILARPFGGDSRIQTLPVRTAGLGPGAPCA